MGFETPPSDLGEKTETKKDLSFAQSEQSELMDVEQIVDMEGRGIDEGIKKCVIALNAANIPTSQSCEGHVQTDGRQITAPWVEICDPNEPEERFVGQNEIFAQIAQKRDLSFEEVARSIEPEAYEEAMKEISKNDETPEFKEWTKKNGLLLEDMRKKLDDFYASQGVPEDESVKIKIDDNMVGDVFRIYSGGDNYKPQDKKLSELEVGQLEKEINSYRLEMDRFAQFLLDNFVQDKTDTEKGIIDGVEKLEKERVRETIENMPIGIDNKMELVLVYCGQKLATEIEFRSNFDDSAQTASLDLVQIEKIKAEVRKLGLTVELSESKLEEHEVVVTDKDGNIVDGQIADKVYSWYQEMMIFKDEQAQDLFHKIGSDEVGMDEILGELYKFPQTAIEVFNDSDQRIQRWELPDELKKEDYYHFGAFIFSRDHWQEEMKTVQKWAKTVKEFSPNIYNEYIKWARDERVDKSGG